MNRLSMWMIAMVCGLGGAALAAQGAGAVHWRSVMEPGSGGRMTAVSVSPHDPDRVLLTGDMLGAGLSTDGGRTWLPTFGFRSYELADVTWHPIEPLTVWCATMSGPYLSRDGGVSWVPRRRGMPPVSGHIYSAPVEKILFDPNDPTHLLAFGGSSRRWHARDRGRGTRFGAVWESRDSGQTWTLLSTVVPGGSVPGEDTGNGVIITAAAFAADSSRKLYIATDTFGAYISEDGGQSWQPASAGLPHGNTLRLHAHPTEPDTAWVSLTSRQAAPLSLPGGVFKTVNGGRMWTPANKGLTQVRHANPNLTSAYYAFAVSPSDPDVMFAGDRAWSVGVIFRSGDGGATWEPVATKRNIGHETDIPELVGHDVFVLRDTAFKAGLGQEYIGIDPGNPARVYTVGSAQIVASRDSGRTWEDLGAHLVEAETPYGPTYAGHGFCGLVAKNIAFDPWQKGRCILQAMDTGRVWMSTDDLITWHYHGADPRPWSGGMGGVFAEGGRIYATFGQSRFVGVGRSLDGGRTWDVLHGEARGLPERNAVGSPAGVWADPGDGRRVWAAIGGALYRSEDAGDTWQLIEGISGCGRLAGDPTRPGRFYVTAAEGVMATDDGRAFRSVGGPKRGRGIACDTRGRVYVSAWRQGDSGGIWRLHDGKWERIFNDPFASGIAVDPHVPGRIAAITDDHPYHDQTFATGVYLSDDDGTTWERANSGLPVLRGSVIAFDPHTPGRMLLGTGGRGFFLATWPTGGG